MAARTTSPAVSTRKQVSNTQRLLLWAGIIAPILFALVFLIDGFLKPGYSAYSEAISYLEVGSYGWIQRVNFLLIGLLLLAFLFGGCVPSWDQAGFTRRARSSSSPIWDGLWHVSSFRIPISPHNSSGPGCYTRSPQALSSYLSHSPASL